MREGVDRVSRRLPWAALVLALLAIAAIRVRVLDVPLERDEGEYAYIGSLLLHGIVPWAEAWNMKLPGIYAVYAALLGVGGSSIAAIHAGLLVANAWNSIACALLARRLFADDGAAAVAGAAYGAMSLSTAVLGLWSHAEPFALAFALGGLLCALEARRAAALAGAGLLLAAAVLVKQNAGPLALFGALWVGARELSRVQPRAAAVRRLALFAAAALLLPLLVALALFAAGVFPRFWFWTTTYALTYGAQQSLERGADELWARLVILWPAQGVWWLAAAVGAAAAVLSAEVRTRAPFLWGLFAAGFVAASLGFWYRPQYFVLLLPALALFAAAAAHALAPAGPRARAVACSAFALVGLVTPIGVEWPLLLRAGPTELSHAVYGLNPFPEALVIAREIAAQTAPGARIGVIGSEPEIYFYADRRAATGYVYTYALMERQPYARAMQQEMIAELSRARPELLVFVSVPDSWLRRPDSPHDIFDWFEQESAGYEAIAFADILSRTETNYVTGEAARSYRPRSHYWLALLRRRPS